MDQTTREDITAATAAHRELGSGYDDAVAEGLVERIGAEIDRRVDAKLGQRGSQPAGPQAYSSSRPASPSDRPAASPRPYWPPVALGLGSMLIGLLASIPVLHSGPFGGDPIGLIAIIWAAIVIINVVYNRHR